MFQVGEVYYARTDNSPTERVYLVGESYALTVLIWEYIDRVGTTSITATDPQGNSIYQGHNGRQIVFLTQEEANNTNLSHPNQRIPREPTIAELYAQQFRL